MANASSDWQGYATQALRDAGHRAGGARGAVVQLLAEQSCCLSAQEIFERLSDGRRNVGLASIYRALDLLHEMGLVQRVEIGDGGSRYEAVMPGGEHHHHAVCETCGKVTAFEDEKLERTLERLSGRLRHSMREHDIVIRGDCARCARAA
jgi:Fur family transcriptional regulator, ferric uptake regulator